MKSLLIVFLCIVASGSALAAPISTTALKADCDAYVRFDQSQQPTFGASYCMGYVLAFTEAAAGDMGRNPDGTFFECNWADGVSADQVTRVFIKYVNDHPESLNKRALETLWRATAESGLRTATPLAKTIVAKEQ
jgi:hypothetical protein